MSNHAVLDVDEPNGLKCLLCGKKYDAFHPLNEFIRIGKLFDQYILAHSKCPICIINNNESALILGENYLTMFAFALKQTKKISIYKIAKLFGVEYKQLQSAVNRMKKKRTEAELKLITLDGMKNQVLMMHKLISSIKLVDSYKESKVVKEYAIDWEQI